MGPDHFPETSFHRIVVSPKCNLAGSLFCQKKKIAESYLTESSHGRIVELAKLHNAERRFSESLFSRTSYLQTVVQPNVVFPEHHLPEHHFAEIVWNKTSFHRTLNRPPAYNFVQCACRCNWVVVIEFEFGHVLTWTWWEFVKFEIRDMDPLNEFSGKWCSAKRRFEKKTFG